MSDIDLHHEFDRLDTGVSEHPDLAGLWAAGQRRRRRARAVKVASGLAVAAVLTPFALIVGGGPTTAPASPGFASSAAPTPVPTVDEAFADIRAAVTQRFPGATPTQGSEFYADLRHAAYAVGNSVQLWVFSATADDSRHDCAGQCQRVGDHDVLVAETRVSSKNRDVFWINVQAVPADAGDPDTVRVAAWVEADSQAQADALLPSAETLIDLATDSRLTPKSFPSQELAYPEPSPEQKRLRAEYGAAITAAVTDAVPQAELGDQDFGHGPLWSRSYTLEGEAELFVETSLDDGVALNPRRECDNGENEGKVVTITCTKTAVGDYVVRVAEVDYSGKGTDLQRAVDFFPADGAGPSVSVDATIHGENATFDALPSVETLKAIAQDARLMPPQK